MEHTFYETHTKLILTWVEENKINSCKYQTLNSCPELYNNKKKTHVQKWFCVGSSSIQGLVTVRSRVEKKLT